MSAQVDLRVIRYTIELKAPLLATDIQGEPNGAVSQPFIPGSLLRGALISAYLAGKRKSEFDGADDVETRTLFLGEETQFLNAYPISKDGRRALPVPASWRHKKDDGYKVGDSFRTVYDRSLKPEKEGDEGVKGDFCWWDEKPALFEAPRQVNVHTQRDARKGRPTVVLKGDDEEETLGAIYRYDALAAGLQLKAAIVTTKQCAATFEELLNRKTFWIGRARRAGYGRAEFVHIGTSDYWRESDAHNDAPRGIADGKTLRFTCASDVLLRDQNGQATFDPRVALTRALKLDPDALALDPQSTWVETKTVGGFNRKWGMALPQTPAIAAGSVFVYRTSQTISSDDLETVELRGIGERRNEGFGRVIANWPRTEDASFESQEYKPESARPRLGKLSPLEEKAARAIARRILRKRMDEKLLTDVNSRQINHAPHKNQIARLRVILRAVQSGRQPIAHLIAYLDDLQERRTSRQQFERATIGRRNISSASADKRKGDTPQPLIVWIKEQINNAMGNWLVNAVVLGTDDVLVKDEVIPALAQEYALRLIDQVLYHATKAQD